MEEIRTWIAAVVAILTGLLTWSINYIVNTSRKDNDNKTNNNSNGRGSNGKLYVTSTQLREHCSSRTELFGLRFDQIQNTLDEDRKESRERIGDLTKAIFTWKDAVVDTLADHRARLRALEEARIDEHRGQGR